MSTTVIDKHPRRTGIRRANQYDEHIRAATPTRWVEILKAYRRYRNLGVARHEANVMAMGYADGILCPLVLTTMKERTA